MEIATAEGGVRASRVFDSYESALEYVVVFTIQDGSASRQSTAASGSCARNCVDPGCPAPSEIIDETLEQGPPFQFDMFGYSCLRCRSEHDLLISCQ